MALTPNTRILQLNRVRLLLQESVAQYWTDALLNIYINEAQFDIAIGLVPGVAAGMEEPLLATESTTPSVNDQELYSLPPNYHGVRTVTVKDLAAGTYSEIPVIDIEYVRSHPRTKSPKPEAYFLWGESGTYQIGMYPAFNSANGTLYVSYWRTPDEMTVDTATLQIPPELHVACTYLAAFKAWFERGHKAESDELRGMFTGEYQAKLPYIRRRQINQKRATMVGVIGDTDTERTLY